MPPPFVLHAHGASAERTATLRAALAAAPLCSEAPLRVAAAADAPPAFDAAAYFAALKVRLAARLPPPVLTRHAVARPRHKRQAERVGATLLSFAELPSTQTLMAECVARRARPRRALTRGARRNVDAVDDGAVCVADVQVSGRGRGGNTWSSPPGCLMFSFNTRCAPESRSARPTRG